MALGGIGGIIAGVLISLWEGIKTVSTFLWENLKEIFAFLREAVTWFIKTAPNWFTLLLFMFLLPAIGSTIMGFFVGLHYACDSNDNLRETEGLISGVKIMITSSLQDAQRNETCEAPITGNCQWLSTQETCDMFNSTSLGDDFWFTCSWDASNGECDGSVGLNPLIFDSECSYMNETQCKMIGCSWSEYNVSDDYILENTNPVNYSYDSGSAEDLWRIECIEGDAMATLWGLNIFNYRYWVMLYLIGAVFLLIRKVKGG